MVTNCGSFCTTCCTPSELFFCALEHSREPVPVFQLLLTGLAAGLTATAKDMFNVTGLEAYLASADAMALSADIASSMLPPGFTVTCNCNLHGNEMSDPNV